jgi:hypothetical protein
MSTGPNVDDLLPVADSDSGCAAGFDVLHRYVEDELSGVDPASSQPGMAAHLRSCPACREDYHGLLGAAELFGDAGPGGNTDPSPL